VGLSVDDLREYLLGLFEGKSRPGRLERLVRRDGGGGK